MLITNNKKLNEGVITALESTFPNFPSRPAQEDFSNASRPRLSFRVAIAQRLHSIFLKEVYFPANYSPNNSERIKIDLPNSNLSFSALYTQAESSSTKGPVIFFSGMKGRLAGYDTLLESLTEKGHDYLAFPLPFPEQLEEQGILDFITVYKAMIKHTLGSVDSVVYKIAKERDMPITIITHSTSGAIIADLLSDPAEKEFQQFLEERCVQIVSIAPFFSAAGASPHLEENNKPYMLGKSKREWFLEHMDDNIDSCFTENLKELIHTVTLAFRKCNEVLARELMPKYGTIKTLMHYGEYLHGRIRQGPSTVSKLLLEQITALNMDDTCSCSVYTEELVKAMGGDTLPIACDNPSKSHNPFQNNVDACYTLIDTLDEKTTLWMENKKPQRAAEARRIAAMENMQSSVEPEKKSVIGRVFGWFNRNKERASTPQALTL